MSLTPEQLKEFTGAPARLTWVQQQEGCTDFVGNTEDLKVMGFDTEAGERELVGTPGAYTSPRLTPDGSRVMYTDNVRKLVHVVDWDGANNRVVAEGKVGLTVWRDPETDIDWLYVRPNVGKEWNQKSKPVTRVQLDNPDIEELVWDRKSVSNTWFQLSPDGKYCATAMFWPSCGYATFPNGEFRKIDKGCWTAMAPDDSYRMWVFDGDHRRVKLFNLEGEKIATIDVHKAEGVDGWEIYFPRWSNHLRYITVAGPFSDNRDHPCDMSKWKSYLPEGACNLIRQGGYNCELHLGRLNEDLTEVEEWVRITHNRKADFHGDAWVAS